MVSVVLEVGTGISEKVAALIEAEKELRREEERERRGYEDAKHRREEQGEAISALCLAIDAMSVRLDRGPVLTRCEQERTRRENRRMFAVMDT